MWSPPNPKTGTEGFWYKQISYSFYKKGVARCSIIPANSGMPEGIKRQTITNELIRRISNCSRNQPETETFIKDATNDYMEAMYISGYDEKTRKETVVSAFKGMAGKLRQASEEGKPLHRHKEEGAGERFKKKISAKSSWFNKRRKETPEQGPQLPNINHTSSRSRRRMMKKKKPVTVLPKKTDNRPIESVVFIPYTKGGRLQKELQSKDDPTPGMTNHHSHLPHPHQSTPNQEMRQKL